MDDIKELNKKLSKIKYGWYDKKGKLHETIRGGVFLKNYRMQDINNIENNGYGICWELCEIERNFFKNKKIKFMTIFAVLNNKKKPCHTFLVYEKNKKFYWFESSWEGHKGISEYESLDKIFEYVSKHFSDFANDEVEKDDVSFYSYRKPIRRIGCSSFYYNAMIFGKRLK